MSENKRTAYYFLPQLLLRAPHYSFGGYDLSRLPEVLQQQEFRNAIWLASPDFYQALKKKDFDFHKLLPKELHTLYKYYNRMCFRPTPFGAFASFTLLNWANGDPVRIGGGDQADIHLLPDQHTLHLVNAVQARTLDGELIVNPCLYKVGKLYRYTKSDATENSRYEFSLEALDAVKFHTGLINLFRGKPLPAAKVLEWIALRGACTPAEALEYLNFLTDAQVLLHASGSRIIYIGEPSDQTVTLPGWAEFWHRHRKIPVNTPMPIAELSVKLGHLLKSALPPQGTQPLYAALEKAHVSGGPAPQEQKELADAVNLLCHLSIEKPTGDLNNFIEEFKERFDREKVPFLLALDPDTGIPYGNLNAPAAQPKVLENIRFPENTTPREQTGWTAVHRLLFRLWTGDTSRDPWSPIRIDTAHRDELAGIKADHAALPQTLSLMYRKTGEQLLIESVGGAAATALTGRLSCFSERVHEVCRRLADIEVNANPHVAFADIGQLSDTHVDNVNRRRRIYPYEIPVNVVSELPLDAQLPPTDLMISVSGGELILESLKLGKRVIPRLATAYNYRLNHLPVFRLLCDLQFQGIPSNLGFDPERLFPGLQFYPRIISGKTVLSLARWNLKSQELEKLLNSAPTEVLEELERFRRTYQIPRFITLGNSDQQLVFDLAHPPESLFFLKCIKGLPVITIKEYLLSGRTVLSGNKPLAGQMIAFLAHRQEIYKGLDSTDKTHFAKEDRQFILGSDWLYLKLFCTPRLADELLTRIIAPFIRKQRRLIKKWFFIRYSEQGEHLRLRIQADPADLGVLLVGLRNMLVSAGYAQLIRNYQGDTYRRELERYGTRFMPLIETVFSAGSELVVKALNGRAEQESGWEEMELGLFTADRMIRSFLPDDQARLTFLQKVTDQFIGEFKGDKAFSVQLDQKYRELKALIADLPGAHFQNTAMRSLIRTVKQIATLAMTEPVTGRTALLANLVHMQMNRTFATRQREQELLVYYILQKQTKSLIARNP